MANNNVAILSVTSKLDEKSAKEVAKRFGKTVEDLNSELGNISFDKVINDKLKAVDEILQKKIFKKANLSSYYNDLFKGIFDNIDDVEAMSKAVDTFSHKINMLSKAGSGQNENAFNMFETSKLDTLIGKAEKLQDIQDKIKQQTKQYNSDANKAAGKSRKISTIDKNYGNQDYSDVLESLQKSLGAEKEFTAEQKEAIGNLAKMLNLYQIMKKSSPEEGTKEAIRYSKDLLTITQKIAEEKSKVDSFTSNGASNYIKNNNLASINDVNEYTVNKSKQDYVKKSLTSLKTQEAKIQSDISGYIKDTISSKLEKQTNEAGRAIDKASKNVDNLQQKIDDLQTASQKANNNSQPLVGNVADKSDIKTLDEIEDRLLDIYELDEKGEASTSQQNIII
jgi:hypothetical protein